MTESLAEGNAEIARERLAEFLAGHEFLESDRDQPEEVLQHSPHWKARYKAYCPWNRPF